MKAFLIWAVVGAAILGLFTLAGAPDGETQRFNLAWSTAFGAELWQGVPYPRHLPGLWQGLGGLDFFFYAPLPFWLTELVRPVCIGCGGDRVLALAGGLVLLLSGSAFYIAARRLVAPGQAAVGAALYMLMPYHLWTDWFHRQAFGEFTAYIAVPLVVIGMHSIIRGHGGLMFAIGWALMLLSHLPTAMLTGHILVVVALVWVILQLLSRSAWTIPGIAGRAILYGVVGTALAAVYWLPALILMGDVSSDFLYPAYFEAHRWLFLDGTDAPNQDFQLRMTVLLGIGAAITLLPWAVGGWGRVHVLLALVPVIVIALMMSALAAPVWQNWVIAKAQFPWRLLVLVDFAAALSVALALAARPWAMWPRAARLGLMALMLGGAALTLPDATRAVLRSPLSLANGIEMGGAAEYTPPALMTASRARETDSHRKAEEAILALAAQVRAQPGLVPGMLSNRKFTVEVAEGADTLVPLPHWQHWKATTPGVAMTPDADTGMTRITASAGTVTLVLPWHWSEWAGLAATVLAALILMVLGIVTRTPLAPAPPGRI